MGICTFLCPRYLQDTAQKSPKWFDISLSLSDKDPHFIHTPLKYLFTQLLRHTRCQLESLETDTLHRERDALEGLRSPSTQTMCFGAEVKADSSCPRPPLPQSTGDGEGLASPPVFFSSTRACSHRGGLRHISFACHEAAARHSAVQPNTQINM